MGNDSNLQNFTIEVSPNQQNVNIQCNSGFYSILVTPCLEIFYPGAEIHKADNNLVIQCRDTSQKTDKSGNVVNNVIFLNIYEVNSCNSLGAVIIHLHHTTRKLQIQGSAKMHRGIYSSIISYCLPHPIIFDVISYRTHLKAYRLGFIYNTSRHLLPYQQVGICFDNIK